jgi:hypothetical protein
MRKASTFVGLSLFALTATARAEEAAPAAAAAASAKETTPATTSTPAKEVAPDAGKTSATTPPAVAPTGKAAGDSSESTIASKAESSVEKKKKFQAGLAFLPMGLGKWTNSPDQTRTVTADAAFAYGFGLSGGYEVIPHLIVGLAPQMILNVKEKATKLPIDAFREFDILARVAGELTVVEGTTVYAELLPGYSLITTDSGPKGFVVAFGVGAAMQMTDRIFVNVGGGYQIGYQKWKDTAATYTTSTKYVRVALGGGVRF